MHQIDETGILLHAMACYVKVTQDMEFVEESWACVTKAANFLHRALDQQLGLSIQSVDIWEEREGFHAYTSASSVAGLKAAAIIGTKLKEHHLADRWAKAADILARRTVSQFWSEKEGRFVSSLHLSAALPMLDSERPELSAIVQHGQRSSTALPQYPNWRDKKSVEVSLRHDISVFALTVSFDLLQPEDSHIRATIVGLREKLWNSKVGGIERYEGDSYGGGNLWPLATLWLAIYEGARGNGEEAASLIDWFINHSTPAELVPEQVHRTLGHPVAAVSLSWSHAMISIAVAALQGRQVWSLSGWIVKLIVNQNAEVYVTSIPQRVLRTISNP
jgi:glucoamylase